MSWQDAESIIDAHDEDVSTSGDGVTGEGLARIAVGTLTSTARRSSIVVVFALLASLAGLLADGV
jgi:hypothetical protein